MADPGTVTSMAEHSDLLWYLVVVLLGGAIIELRIYLRSMSKKQDELIQLHGQCQKDLPKEYASLKKFEALEADRTKRWDKFFFKHSHHPTGEVRIPQSD